jgi:hypothetical protein
VLRELEGTGHVLGPLEEQFAPILVRVAHEPRVQ